MGRLHCTQDPVPEAVGGDMQQLSQLGAQVGPAELDGAGPGSPRLGVSATADPERALKKNLTAEQVQADLITLGLSEERATYFSEKWKQNAPILARRAIGQTLMINQLIDMEWRFGVTSGSSELEKVGSIFLQLKLVVKKGNQTENVYIELTLPQFYSFLHEMERVRASMECFS
ncbi:PREDICTED: COMM domain-containing protein 7 [Dipodomys ordii]|uniref:COMM domain-containing protein 7 n=1 Tax=Dipodomys ordii TaxID=10020 RepID=A0A1S3EQ99_DIPOR|nr:PREDICTED: COMM domain-containing protein 7 [Dipodomys ordii]